jgi:hypothetical protein
MHILEPRRKAVSGLKDVLSLKYFCFERLFSVYKGEGKNVPSITFCKEIRKIHVTRSYTFT